MDLRSSVTVTPAYTCFCLSRQLCRSSCVGILSSGTRTLALFLITILSGRMVSVCVCVRVCGICRFMYRMHNRYELCSRLTLRICGNGNMHMWVYYVTVCTCVCELECVCVCLFGVRVSVSAAWKGKKEVKPRFVQHSILRTQQL